MNLIFSLISANEILMPPTEAAETVIVALDFELDSLVMKSEEVASDLVIVLVNVETLDCVVLISVLVATGTPLLAVCTFVLSMISLRVFRGFGTGLGTGLGTNVGREALRLFLEGMAVGRVFCGIDVDVVEPFCALALTTPCWEIYTTLGPDGPCCIIPTLCWCCSGETPC